VSIERRGFLRLLVAAPVACGGSLKEPSFAREQRSVLIEGVPHVRQRPDFCGEACVAMVLAHLGHDCDQDDVFDASGVDPELGRGCYTADLKRALDKLGFEPGKVWWELPISGRDEALEEAWARVHTDLLAGIPAIVCMRYDDEPDTTEHMRLVLGYDADTDEVVYHEPAEDGGAYRTMPRERLVELWPVDVGDDRKAAIHLRMRPTDVHIPTRPDGHRPAAFSQHIRALHEQVSGRGFVVVLEEPFVVVGEGARTRRYATKVVRWAVDRLRRAYFDRDPEPIIDVWLFEGARSYEKNALELFGTVPSTPYGYYSSEDTALVMNIATGGGTLVHEIVHPFMAANFPSCPSWFDEGLASLYEQSTDDDGEIKGLTNWRLPGLQEAIRAGTLPSFRRLCTAGNHAFYHRDPGTNYAQARYLCYWLQEHGLLRPFYRAFRAASPTDPTGYETLERTIGATSMRAFRKKWEAFVLGLEFA